MQFIAQFRDPSTAENSDYERHLKRLWPVIATLAAKDDRLADWFLQGSNEEEARLYPVYEAPNEPSTAAKAVLREQYQGEDKLAKTIGMWNGRIEKKEGASISLGFDTGAIPCDFELTVGEENATSSRLGDFESVAEVVATIATTYAPAYITAAPRKYASKQVFDDKPGVGWMLYLPKPITSQHVPEAHALVPVTTDGKQIGTIIVSAIDVPFSIDNPEHVETANRIEIRLVDQDLLPRYTDI